MKIMELTRSELYTLVWQQPMGKLATTLDTTANNLKAICRAHDIPTPLNGHWIKLQHNKKVVVLSLPESEGNINPVVFDSNESNPTIGEGLSALEVHKHHLRNVQGLSFNVPDRIENPDSLIIAAKSFFESKTSFKEDKIQPTPSGTINIAVSQALVIRALRLMDTLIKIFRKRGHEVKVSGNESLAIVFGQELKIALIEETKKVTRTDGKWPYYTLEPSGILSLKLDESWRGKKYSDGKSPLESRLLDLYARIELVAKEVKERQEAIRLNHEKWEAAKKQEKLDYERQQNELSDFKATLAEAKRHYEVNLLRAYIQDVEQTLHRKSDEEHTRLREWISRATEWADWYDPKINLRNPLLENVDKNTLELKIKRGYY